MSLNSIALSYSIAPRLMHVQERYRAVLHARDTLQLSAEETTSAWYGFATSLQYSAECTISGSKSCGDDEVRLAEEGAVHSAALLLSEAVNAYKQASPPSLAADEQESPPFISLRTILRSRKKSPV